MPARSNPARLPPSLDHTFESDYRMIAGSNLKDSFEPDPKARAQNKCAQTNSFVWTISAPEWRQFIREQPANELILISARWAQLDRGKEINYESFAKPFELFGILSTIKSKQKFARLWTY